MATTKQAQHEQSQAIAEKQQTAMMAAADMEADSGGGFEDADKDSYAIPAITIIQKGSPQVDKDHPKYKPIPGAEVGHLINTVTEEVFPGEEGIVVLPCHFQHGYTVWRPRNEGGGLVSSHTADEGAALLKTAERDEKNRDVLPDGNQLVDTRTHYVLVLRPDGTAFPAILRLSSTQIKKSKKWMSNMKDVQVRRADGTTFTPPMWAKTYRLKTVAESNAEGTWRGWDITREGDCPSAELYQMAKGFRDAVRTGKVRSAEETADGEPIPF